MHTLCQRGGFHHQCLCPLPFYPTLRLMGEKEFLGREGGKWRGTQSLIVAMKQVRKAKWERLQQEGWELDMGKDFC